MTHDAPKRRTRPAALAACAAMVPLLALAVPGRGVLGAIAMLVGLIVVHELGHFLAARWLGFRVTALAIGMGPA
jgi:hypothetical protein